VGLNSPGLEKNHDFFKSKNQFFLFKSHIFYLNQIFEKDFLCKQVIQGDE